MHPSLPACAGLVLITACTRPAPAPSVEGAPAGGTGEAAAAQARDAGGGYRVEAETLDRYLRYQDRTLALHAELLEALSKLPDRGPDAGPDQRAVELIRRHARAQEDALEAHGLSETDLDALDRIVGDVIGKRAVSPAKDTLASLKRMEELAQTLPEEQRAEFDESLASLREKLLAEDPLTREREAYGDANVDAVLAREAELVDQWNRAIAVFAGSGPRQDAGTGHPVRPERRPEGPGHPVQPERRPEGP